MQDMLLTLRVCGASIYAYMDGCTCIKKRESFFFLAKLALLVPCVLVCVLVYCIESAVCSRTGDLVPSAR